MAHYERIILIDEKTSPVTGYHAELWALVSRLALETMQQ